MTGWILATVAGLVAAAGQDEIPPATVLEDFDGPAALSDRWTAAGAIEVRRIEPDEPVEHDGVDGHLIRARGEAGALLVVRADFPRPDFESSRAVRFRVRSTGPVGEMPPVIEFQAFAQNRHAWFWRKISIDSDRWQTVEVPLRFCRQSPVAALSWSDIHRFGFYFRDSAELEIDRIELVPASESQGAYLTAEELSRLAFGETGRVDSDGLFQLVTDAERLNREAVLQALGDLADEIGSTFEEWPRPSRPVILIVFAREADYRAFWPQLADRFESTIESPRADGLTANGIATTYFSDQWGEVRPVYVHEACHAYLAQALGISNHSEWLHEGLAAHFQLLWSGDDRAESVGALLRQARLVPLATLTNGEPISTDHYLQAAWLVRWMLEDERRRRSLNAALASMRERGSTELPSICEPLFGMTVDQMQTRWRSWLFDQLR